MVFFLGVIIMNRLSARQAFELSEEAARRQSAILADIFGSIRTATQFGDYSVTMQLKFTDIGTIAKVFLDLGFDITANDLLLTIDWSQIDDEESD